MAIDFSDLGAQPIKQGGIDFSDLGGQKIDQQPSGDYWGDVRQNALAGLKEWPRGALALGETALGAANMTSPIEMGRSAFQAIRGTPLAETSLGQDVRSTTNLITGTPKGLFQTAKDIGSAAIMPVQVAMGTTPGKTSFGSSFRERPLSTTANVATAAVPIARLFRGGKAATTAKAASTAAPGAPAVVPEAGVTLDAAISPARILKTPNYLETQGGRGLYSTTGIRGLNVEKLTHRGQNPGAVGTNLIKELSDEGAIGSTSAQTWDKVHALKKRFGLDVDNALKAIAKESEKYGAVENPLAMSAEDALKPIYDAWAEHAGGLTSASKNLAKEFKHVHDGLTKIAKRQGGIISLDDIRKAMKEVGPLTHKGALETQQAMAELYATLADTRDTMVGQIAKQAKNPALKSDLLTANAKFSRYSRIMPDVSRAAAMESVGQPNLGGLIDHFRRALLRSPKIQRGVMDTGGLFNKGPAAPAKPILAPRPPKVTPQGPGFIEKKLKNQQGSIFPSSVLPSVPSGSKTGPAHALYAYEDSFGPGGAKRKLYNVFGDPSDPAIKQAGWGSSVPEERLRELGIPVTGKEVKRVLKPR